MEYFLAEIKGRYLICHYLYNFQTEVRRRRLFGTKVPGHIISTFCLIENSFITVRETPPVGLYPPFGRPGQYYSYMVIHQPSSLKAWNFYSVYDAQTKRLTVPVGEQPTASKLERAEVRPWIVGHYRQRRNRRSVCTVERGPTAGGGRPFGHSRQPETCGAA